MVVAGAQATDRHRSTVGCVPSIFALGRHLAPDPDQFAAYQRECILYARRGPIRRREPILNALARAYHWQRLPDEGRVSSAAEIARQEGLNPTTVWEVLRLTLLCRRPLCLTCSPGGSRRRRRCTG